MGGSANIAGVNTCSACGLPIALGEVHVWWNPGLFVGGTTMRPYHKRCAPVAAHTAPLEQISKAAICSGDLVFSMERPARHHSIFREVDRCGGAIPPGHVQGFLTSAGRFVDRREACAIARAAGQILVKTGPADELFSEDVW